jgi:uncharacterized protein YdhG (YjbR/CyaY superfamily)
VSETDLNGVDEYIATFPGNVQEVLEAVRRAIRKALPEAEERISYQMPAYRIPGGWLYFGGFTRHFSLFPGGSDSVLAAFEEELAPYKVSKGTISFPLDQPPPVDLIGRLARHRAEELRLKAAEAKRSRK